MTQVSRRLLPQGVEERIFEILWQSLADLNSAGKVEKFLEDLLSKTEKMMLAKRLAIAVMLAKGFKYRGIQETLKVSGTTVMLVSNQLKLGGTGYRQAIDKLIKDEKIVQALDKIGDMLSALPKGKPYSSGWIREQKERRKIQSNRAMREEL